MSDAYEHNPGDHEDPMGGPTWLVGFVGTIILIVIVLAVTAVLKFTEIDTQQETLIEWDVTELTEIQNRDSDRLHGNPRVVEYVDENGNVATRLVIPLDDAIQKTAEEFGRTDSQAAAGSTMTES